MLIHFFIIPNLMAKHHARRDGAAWLIPVLARRAHRIDRSGQGWMVCRVPVAFQIATGDDARSLRPPALLPAKRRTCGAATPVFFQVQRVMTRAIGDQPGHPCHESAMATTPSRLFLLASAWVRKQARGRQ